MFTGIFRVKGGGRFMAITFRFLTVVFSVVVALLSSASLPFAEAISSCSLPDELSTLLSLSEVFSPNQLGL